MAAGGSTQVLVVADVSSDSTGTLANTASVIANQPDPARANNTTARTVAVLAAAPQAVSDVQITKRVGPAAGVSRTAADRHAHCHQPWPASGRQRHGRRHAQPRAARHLDQAQPGSMSQPPTAALRAWSDPPGRHATITITGTVARAGIEHNSATAVSAGNDPHAAGNLAGARTTIKPVLRLAKTASPNTITAGGRVAYHLTVSNPTSVAIKHVRVCDALPLGLALDRTVPKAKLSNGKECWTVKRLGARHARRFTVKARALRGTRGRLTNHASATGRDATAAKAKTTIRVKPAPEPPATPVTG